VERALARAWKVVVTAGLIGWQAAVSLRHNWGLGILSVVLAASFWIYVTDREDPERTARVPGWVPITAVNLPPDQAVASISQNVVAVSARAPQSVLEKLVADDFRATVDLSEMTAQEAEVTISVESDVSRAEVVDFSPSAIRVTLEPLGSRTVPVRAQEFGGLPRGFSLGAIEVDIEEAVVTGPDRLVEDVAVAQADVDLSDANASFEQRVSLEARSASGAPIQNVDVTPESAVVRVEVIQMEFAASFVVVPDVSGEPADGYNVTGIEVDPPFVTISGPAEAFRSIDRLEGVMTESIPIDDATDPVVRTVALRLPQGASAEPAGVTVRISISPAEGTFSFSVVPRFSNVGSGLVATLQQPTVGVALAGTVPDLSAIDLADIVATLDLEGLEAGEHAVPLLVQAPPGTTVDPATQSEVAVTLR
jgi:YbbR domain-containing protein